KHDAEAARPLRRKAIEKMISTIKMLRLEDVWHPRIGAPRGNRNALKHGRYTNARKAQKKRLALVRAGVRALQRRARKTIFEVEAQVQNHQYSCINSRAQSGSLISPRGRKPFITGLMSSTGVPSM